MHVMKMHSRKRTVQSVGGARRGPSVGDNTEVRSPSLAWNLENGDDEGAKVPVRHVGI